MDEVYEKICQAIVAISEHQDVLEQKIVDQAQELADLRKVVKDEIIGGIESLYQENVRTDGITGLKTKYSDKFGPLEPDFGEIYGGDLWERLYDALAEVAEAEREPQIMKIYENLKSKFDKVKGVPAAVEATVVTPAEPEKPEETPAAEAEPAGSMDELIKKTIGKLKGRGAGIMAGAREE